MQITQKRILEDIMPVRLIREVEKWPVIYDNSPDMLHHQFRYKVWEQVAKNVIDNFAMCTYAEKKAKVSDLMKKWRHFRDTYIRHLNIKDGRDKKRRELEYFKHMSFLLPHLTDETHEKVKSRRWNRQHLARRTQHARSEEISSSSSSTFTTDNTDADKHFLLSLLPTFKCMSEDEKLTAKMHILKVLKNVKSASREPTLADSRAATDSQQSDDDELQIKSELFTIEMSDYTSFSDTGHWDND